MLAQAHGDGLLSSEHVTVEDTLLIEAAAPPKSPRRKGNDGEPPAGDTTSPRLASALATRTCPNAGCSMAICTIARSISGATRFFSTRLRRPIAASVSFPLVVQLPEAIETVARIPQQPIEP